MDDSTDLPPVDELEGVESNERTAIEGTVTPDGVLLEEGTGVNDEIDDEADVEGGIQSSVQVAPTGETSELGDEFNPMLFIQLGDRVVIDSKKYGRTIGTVYYRSLELISVKPDGVSNMLHDFEIDQTDEEELYKEEDGVTAAYVIEKRKFESFVEQQDFRINQIIDTFTSSGELYKSYKLVKVDKENDFIQIQELDDDTVYDLNFNFIGIEPDEDFKVISIRQLVSPEEGIVNEAQVIDEGQEGKEDTEEAEAEEAEEAEEEPSIVGFIEVTRAKVFREAAAYEQRIPDSLQKVDALNDFISGLDPILQKDPKSIRAVRILVETLFNLKQSTVAYNDDGTIRGTKDISVLTLTDLIKKVPIPLGRPVLNIIKKIYPGTEILEPEQEKSENGDTENIYLVNFLQELETIIQYRSQIVSSNMATAPGSQVVMEWIDQQDFLKKYLSPWITETTHEPLWRAIADSEVFRQSPPDFTEIDGKNIFIDTITGLIPTYDKKADPVINKIPFGIERALSTTYRKGVDRKKQVLLPEESATMTSYLLFPAKTATSLGATRTMSLAIDSGRSQSIKETYKSILKSLGSPKEVGTSNDLILLDVDKNTLGNIPLADYIEGISVPALGLGDTLETLYQYGLDSLEFTPNIIEVLLKKIELYQSQLLSTISKLRKVIDSQPPKTPENNTFLDIDGILEAILSQPTLVEDIQDYERINPSLAQSDIGKIAYIMNKHPDYLQVAAGKNSILIAKALLNSNNDTYIQTLRIANILKYNQLNSGIKPLRNTCKHVSDMVSINRIKDDSERFQKLTEYFKKYQGEREDNWINCNICKQHLLCIHERLQIQAYLNPIEKMTIEKEIILKFSGGSFQGKYICRNCGQAIKDFDFDNNIEFDDDGKPKSGRAQLVDKDALLEEKLDILVSVPIEQPTQKELNLNDDEIRCYNIIREIAERIGITFNIRSYRTIIDRTISWVNRFPSRDDYNEKKKKKPTMPDYDVAISRNIITAAATFILIEIQINIPSYPVKHILIGCKSPGFEGYPIDIDATKKQGIEYIACAVASIRRNESPWNQTGFQKVADDTKRQQGIAIYMDNILKEIIGDDMIQSQLSEKRKWLLDNTLNKISTTQIVDEIPATFLPEQIILTPENAAKNVITPEVVANMGSRGRTALVRLWIRQAHLLAKKTATLVRGSPMIETSCCLANIQSPEAFWKSASDLPQIGKRQLIPYQQGHMLSTDFIPRPAGADVAKPDSELYYRIFLKCCFQGPRIGYSHEPGLTHVCTWCGFQFPTNPSVMDTNTEGKTALASQNIQTGTDEFIKLLDTIHVVNKVDPITIAEILSVRDIMSEFGNIIPAPILNWNSIISQTTDQFLQLPPDADKGDIALAAGVISEATTDSEKIIHERLIDETYHTILEDIVKLSWINFFQVIQSYFITPLQRLLTNFSDTSLFVPIELQKELSEDHINKDIRPILVNDLQLVKLKEADIKRANLQLARVKLQYFIEQMSKLLNFKSKIRPIVVPGRDATLVYIQRAILYGPLATLINPSEIPPDSEITSPIKSIGNPSMRFLLELIAVTLNKYRKERLSYNDQDIKELIAIRNEKERVNVIAEFNKLSDEERAIELMNKKLGIGKWAVGGTKLIYAYDKDYYDMERQKREAAGIIDFPGLGPDQVEGLEGRQTDEYGFPVFNEDTYEREGGYSHRQHMDDDE